MYFMSDPQALHVTRNVIPGKLGVDLHLHRVHIPLVGLPFILPSIISYKSPSYLETWPIHRCCLCQNYYIITIIFWPR